MFNYRVLIEDFTISEDYMKLNKRNITIVDNITTIEEINIEDTRYSHIKTTLPPTIQETIQNAKDSIITGFIVGPAPGVKLYY